MKGKDNAKLNVTLDVANLFGNNNQSSQNCQTKELVEGDGLTLTTVKPTIFRENAWDNISAPDWNYQTNESSSTIDYYRLDVETINNACFGIKEGQKGELNIFNNINTNSDTAPSSPSIFNEYGDLYKTLIDGISGAGAQHVLYSLGFADENNLPNNSTISGNNYDPTSFQNESCALTKNIVKSKNQRDILTGTECADIYQFKRQNAFKNKINDRNVIRNFDVDSGDQIDLSWFEELVFIDSKPFSAPNQVRWNGNALKINLVGSKNAEMAIKLVDFDTELAATDLIL